MDTNQKSIATVILSWLLVLIAMAYVIIISWMEGRIDTLEEKMSSMSTTTLVR